MLNKLNILLYSYQVNKQFNQINDVRVMRESALVNSPEKTDVPVIGDPGLQSI